MNANTTTSDARDIRLANYLLSFALAFLYYDHLITIDREIKYVWGRPKMLSAYLFLANRYVPFLANLVVALFQVTNFDLQSCKSYNLSRQLLLIVNQSLVLVLMTLRVSALYGRWSRVFGSMVVLVGAADLGVTGWALSGQQIAVAQQLSGCHFGYVYDTSIRLVVPWIAVFAYDSMIFAFTLAKTWQAGRKVRIHGRLPIIALLLRDGTIYFAVMALANLANILTFYFCGTFLRGGLSTFSNSISVTMMSRLMLNLHETASVGIFSVHISTLGPMSRAENFDESLVLSELPHSPEHVGGAGPQEIARDRTEMPNLP